MSKAKTKDYVVTHGGVCLKGTIETEVGKKVQLTEEKAKSMVGKVRLLSEFEADNKTDDDLKKDNVKLTESNEGLFEDNVKLTDQLAKSTAINNELTGKLGMLTESDKKLTKDNKALTKTNAELTEQLAKLTEQLTAGSK